MGGALLIIAAAIALMPPTMLLQAAGLVVVGVALEIIAKVMQTLGGMSWGDMAHALVAMAGALVIIAAGLYLMSGALPGAAALVVATAETGATAGYRPIPWPHCTRRCQHRAGRIAR